MTVAQEVFFPIRELSTYQAKWTIRARVTNKATLRSWKKNDREGKVFSADLLDAEGGEIRASFFNDAADAFYEKLQVGKCFTLSKGSVKIANRQYNSCKHRYELVFDKLAQVEEVQDDAKIQTVSLNVENLRSVKDKQLPASVDVCGIITSFNETIAFTSKDGKSLVKRVLTIADDSAVSMQVTIWGDRAQQDDSKFSNSPVVAMKGVFVKEWQGGLSGSLLESGSLMLNPTDVPEAAKVQNWWSQGGSSQALTFISQTSGGGNVPEGKKVSVEQMRSSLEQVSGTEHYTVYCRLNQVQTRKRDENQPLFYSACMDIKEGDGPGKGLACQKKVDAQNFCSSCNRVSAKVGTRMNLRCRFEDGTDGFWVTTFHEAAQKAIGMQAEEAKMMEDSQGREALESSLKRSYNDRPLKVTVRAKPDSYDGQPRTNISCINVQHASYSEHGRAMLAEIRDMIVA